MVKEKNIETSDKFCEAEMVKIREQNYFSRIKKSVALRVEKLLDQESKTIWKTAVSKKKGRGTWINYRMLETIFLSNKTHL